MAPALAFAQEKTWFDRALALGPVLGPIVASLVAFIFGLATCITPCVFPMIAITVSIFGAKQAQSRRQAVLLSTCFVLGIVALFTPMFVAAALSGKVFGAVLQSKVVVLLLAAVFIALALSMFGLFEMALPEALQQRLATVGGVGYRGAFLVGLVSSLVAAPCVGPVATSILIFIGQSQDVVLGAIFGAAYALGLGLPFWLVGAFAVSLPKGGKWMLWVKSFFGVVMITVALYFLKNPFPALASLARPTGTFALAMLLVVAVGIALGAIHLDWQDGGVSVKLRKALGIGVTVVGSFFLVVSATTPREASAAHPHDPALASSGLANWLSSEAEALATAREGKRPLLVDFTADWCEACKKLAKHTFSDAKVLERCKDFVALKVDATNDEDPAVEAITAKYKVVGLPTVVVFDSSGTERKRINDFMSPEEFLRAIQDIQ